MTFHLTSSADDRRSKLDRAIQVIELCEAVFADPEKAACKGYDLDAKYAVHDFLGAYRSELRKAGTR